MSGVIISISAITCSVRLSLAQGIKIFVIFWLSKGTCSAIALVGSLL